jgi:hypothetical protein
MNTRPHRSSSQPALALLLLCAGLASGATSAAPAVSDARARYEQERAVCLSGQSSQDRATCLREAGAAYADAGKRNADESAAQNQKNATKRCDALPDPDRRDCMARMQGQGTTSGSVAGGGITRELVTREAGGVPMAAAPVPSASSPVAASSATR